MLDNQLISLVIGRLNAGYTALGLTGIAVKQSYQPTRQGANSAPTVYIHKLHDERMGWTATSETWIGADLTTEDGNTVTTEGDSPISVDDAGGHMQRTETQQYVSWFQLSGLALQNPSDTASLTASDIVNYAASILQGNSFIQFMESYGVGVLKVGQIRNVFFEDDFQKFESNPSFDFGLTHKQTIISQVPVLTSTEYQILTV